MQRRSTDTGGGPGIFLTAGVVCLVLFALLTVCVSAGRTQSLDERLAQQFYSVRTTWLTGLIRTLTWLGSWKVITAICVVLVAFPATRKPWGIPVSALAIATNMLRAVVKMLIGRPRPDRIYHLVKEGSWSFPSGHALTAIAVYGFLAWNLWKLGKKWRWLAVICAVLAVSIGLSRIYLGVHYPCDVLGGWLAGAGLLLITIALTGHFSRKNLL